MPAAPATPAQPPAPMAAGPATATATATATAAAPDPASAMGFYAALRGAYAQRIAVLRPQPAADLAAALVALAAEAFDGNLDAQCEGQPPVACTKGCATCCSLRVAASAPELLLIARYLRATAPAWARAHIHLEQRLREADTRTRGLGEAERVALRQRCPFIVQGACAIYQVRPLACRGHASLDVRACVDAAAGRRDDVPYSQPYRLLRSLVQTALLSALDEAALPWGLSELNEGLVTLLDAADARAAATATSPAERAGTAQGDAAAPALDNDSRWRRGDDPLAGVTQSPEDMAQWREAMRELDTLALAG